MAAIALSLAVALAAACFLWLALGARLPASQDPVHNDLLNMGLYFLIIWPLAFFLIFWFLAR